MADLGKKQRITNAAFVDLYEHATQRVARDYLYELTRQTVKAIKSTLGKGKRVAVSWSGGKDSIVLYHIATTQLGIGEGVLVLTQLEYPGFLRWLADHQPPRVTTLTTPHDIHWLAANPHLLFPDNSRLSMKWFKPQQHAHQEQYFRRRELDYLLMGRRVQDGNYIGNRETGVYVTKGVRRYAPLRNWRHEDVMAYLRYHDLALPPFYTWPNGFVVGTGPWGKRRRRGGKTIRDTWAEIWQIDPTIVRDAAPYLTTAAAFLSGAK